MAIGSETASVNGGGVTDGVNGFGLVWVSVSLTDGSLVLVEVSLTTGGVTDGVNGVGLTEGSVVDSSVGAGSLYIE